MMRAVLCILLLGLGLCLAAADEVILEMKQPDHLEPISPESDRMLIAYNLEVQARLKLWHWDYLRMVVRPSFRPEYTVKMLPYHSEELAPADRYPKVHLEYSVVDKNIWYAGPGMNHDHPQQDVAVTTITVEFPQTVAERVLKVWRRMLLRTRWEEGFDLGNDGTTYFFALGGMCGETWSPQKRQSPKLLVELGHSLIDYCKANPLDREAAQRAILEKADALEKYLNEHAQKPAE